MARVIASGALPRLEALSFLLNDVGDDGARALAAALGRKWVATRLSRVDLCGNSIRDGGAKALAAALAHGGACPSLRQVVAAAAVDARAHTHRAPPPPPPPPSDGN